MVVMLLTHLSAAAQSEYSELKCKALSVSTVEIVGYPEALDGGELVIPSQIGGMTVVSIGHTAFKGCGITSLTLPETISEIGYGAFMDCDRLLTVNIGAVSPPHTNGYSFGSITMKLGRLLVPTGCREAYKDMGFWHVYDNGGEREYHTLTITTRRDDGKNDFATFDVNGIERQGAEFTHEFDEGLPITVKVTPSKDYELLKMTVNGEDVTNQVEDNTYQMTGLAGNTLIEVTARQKPVGLTVGQAAGGSVTVVADRDIKNYQMRVVPDEGYSLSQLTEDKKDLLRSLDYRRDFDRYIDKKGAYTVRYKKDQ